MKILAAIACLLLAACQSEAADTAKGDCQAKGGMLVRGLGLPVCSMPTPDAGKICTDSSQCAGLCRAPGRCSAQTDEFGCVELLEDGKPMVICMD